MRLFFLAVILSAGCMCSCASSESKAKELLETALFEEKQNNYEHAGKLYDEILQKYPKTQVARDAALRQNSLKSRKP